MKILKLALSNFQGIKDLELTFDGASGSIYGDNATGKTTVYNAVTWLLFGKSSTGSTGFTPKTRTADGEAHNLEHSVTASFETERGVISFQKTMKEVYKKKRGTNVAEFSGHTIDYYVNGVPAKEKEYTERVNAICGDAEKSKLLTMPFYFPEQISWQDRRKILLDICGDVSDEEVIRRKGLGELLTFLTIPGGTGMYSVDEYRKIAASQRKAIQSELATIPARVDEANKAMPEVTGTVAEWKAVLDEIQEQVEKLKEEKVSILANDRGREEQRRQLAELDTEYAKAESEHIKNHNMLLQEYRRKTDADKKRLSEVSVFITTNQNKERNITFEISRMAERRKALLDRYNIVATSSFEGDLTCPTCGQPLPADKVAEAKAAFNLNKSNELEKIRKEGAECSKEKIEELKKQLDSINISVGEALREQRELESKLKGIKEPVYENFEGTDRHREFMRRKADILTTEKESAPDTSGIDEMIRQLDGRAASANNAILNFQIREQQEQRIAELEEREAQLANQFDYMEKGLFLCDEFVRAKVELLTDGINGHFKNVKFQLFADQINGGLKETCEVLIPSPAGNMVPFATANNAARINAGLEIIGTLSDAWNIKMPVFIDNAEAVTKITPPGDNQTIRLIVSEKDRKLRLVLDKKAENIGLEGQMDLGAFMNVPEV